MVPIRPIVSYRKRRDLALKKFSTFQINLFLAEQIVYSGILHKYSRGRPCEVPKEQLIAFILLSKIFGHGYEEMEINSQLFLGRHYDHSLFQYHYTELSEEQIIQLNIVIEEQIKTLLNEIKIHIFDSTALSTSVREERIRQGTRNKVLLTTKFHTMIGYDPPNQCIVVENMLATDKHTSDAQGARIMLKQKENISGYGLGDGAYETYDLIDETEEKGLMPLYKPQNKEVRKKLSAKMRLRKVWNGNHSRLYKDLRGTVETLYGAATRAKIIHTNSIRDDNREKDGLIIGLRQNLLTILRLKSLKKRIIRKTLYMAIVL